MKATADRKLDPSKVFRPGMLKRLLRAFPTLDLAQPVFFGIGTADTAALPMTTLALVTDLCIRGNVVEARIYKDKDHSGVVNAAVPDAIRFADAVLHGQPVPATCRP